VKDVTAPSGNENNDNDTKDDSDLLVSSSTTIAPPSPPLEVWFAYLRQHGTTALSSDTVDARSRRRYLIAPYWCPDRAGNVLHNLWNGVTWALLLNRTLMVQWDATNPNGNTREACKVVLPTHREIPIWDEWHDTLDIQQDDIQSIPLDPMRIHYDETLMSIMVPQIPDVYHNRLGKDDDLYRNGWNDHPLTPGKVLYREYLQSYWHKHVDRQHVAVQCLSYGIPFWYGLLLRHVFTLPAATRTVSDGPGAVLENGTTNTTMKEKWQQQQQQRPHFSLALHSRHVAPADDGSLVPDEIGCLTRLLSDYGILFNDDDDDNNNNNHHTIPCTIYLLSDRRATISVLTEWIHRRAPTCRVHTTSHGGNHTDTTRVKEHGPFAGIGFLQDLSMATSHGNDMTALVGDMHRSSFALLYELVIYDKFSKHDNIWNIEDVDIPLCSLPARTARGYSYGPDSPLFVRDPLHFPILGPLKVLYDYPKKQDTFTSFAVVQARCPWDDDYNKFLAAVIFGLLTDRLLLWTPPARSNCTLPPWLPPLNERTAQLYDLKLEDAVDMQQSEATKQRFVSLSNTTLDLFVHAFGKGDFLRPNQGGGRRKTAEDLYAYGPKFLFGTLFENVYDFQPPRVPTLENSAWTIGVDARTDPTTEKLKSCLSQTMLNRTTEECQVVLLLSHDHKLSRQLQQDIQTEYKCSVMAVPADSSPERTMAVAGQVRHGWIDASTQEVDAMASRIREYIEWKRIQARWNMGKFPVEVPPFVDCSVS